MSNELQQTMRDAAAKQGIGVNEIARLATKAGYKISNATVSAYMNGAPQKRYGRDRLKAIAHVLHLDLAHLLDLAGLPAESNRMPLDEAVRTLTPEQVDAINRMIRVIAKGNEELQDAKREQQDEASTIDFQAGQRRRYGLDEKTGNAAFEGDPNIGPSDDMEFP